MLADVLGLRPNQSFLRQLVPATHTRTHAHTHTRTNAITRLGVSEPYTLVLGVQRPREGDFVRPVTPPPRKHGPTLSDSLFLCQIRVPPPPRVQEAQEMQNGSSSAEDSRDNTMATRGRALPSELGKPCWAVFVLSFQSENNS